MSSDENGLRHLGFHQSRILSIPVTLMNIQRMIPSSRTLQMGPTGMRNFKFIKTFPFSKVVHGLRAGKALEPVRVNAQYWEYKQLFRKYLQG
mmetsp:Transcript_15644/g.27283  ORF Transcript_15644/g.27283 Transcript_15644/m.27283 type:complete len:92 (-) Transcript_15644:1183-1458(-)